MSVGGQVGEVRVEPRGSQLHADAASGATSITVTDPAPFDLDGGQIQLDGVVYTYSTMAEVDDTVEQGMTNGVLALTSGLTAAATAMTRVDLWSGTQVLDDVVLVVDTGPDAPPVEVRVNTSQRKDWSALEGILEPPVGVTLSDDLDRLLDADGYTPPIDGRDLDPTTLPDQVPTESPDTVLTVTVTGDAEGITAVATPDGNISGTTLISWAIDGVVKETTQSLVYRFTTDSTGAGLSDTGSYSITAQPTNVVGPGAVSNPVIGKLNAGVSSKTVLGWVAAGFFLAGTIQVGQMTLSPPTSDSPGGLNIPLTNGGQILLPADGSDAIMTAILRARSLVVENNLRILGTLNAVIGGLQLANGTSAPTIKPRAGTSWSHAAASLQLTNLGGPELTPYARGLHLAGGQWTTVSDAPYFFVSQTYDSSGANLFTGALMPNGFAPKGGAVKIGSTWYVLGQDGGRSSNWYVFTFNTSWVKTGEWLWSTTVTQTPAIATDGTSVFIAYQVPGGTTLRVGTYSTAGVAGSFYVLDTSWNAAITGLYVGSADFGASRVVVSKSTGVRVYTNTGASGSTQTRLTANEWTPANAEPILGLAWDGTRFHTLSSTGKIWHYSTIVAATSRSITHTWYDNDAAGTGTHETEASPALTYSQAPRQWLQVDTDPPSFAGFPDDPNAVRIYVANQRQADLATGQTTVVYDTPATGGSAAPTSNGFAGVSAPGSVTSGATDGSGPLTKWDGSGVGRAAKLIQSGHASVSTSAASSGFTDITFPVAFNSTPEVVATAQGTTIYFASVSAITATGVRLLIAHRDGTSASNTVTVSWIATVAS